MLKIRNLSTHCITIKLLMSISGNAEQTKTRIPFVFHPTLPAQNHKTQQYKSELFQFFLHDKDGSLTPHSPNKQSHFHIIN
uniref:Ovule protein n=1 Tax=Meloidogyne incognita TaxID=6306 RepID=A0A914NEA4_MELIC